jgi:chemotaxis protein CheX
MNDALLELPPVSSDDIITITQAVWSSFLELELTAVPCESAVLTGPVLLALVRISGAWEGAVQLECSPDHARAAAAAMFAGDAGTASDDEARDALGELANIVSGNLKSLLPPPSALSIPWVRPAASSTGSAEDAEPATQEPLRRVAFVAAPGVLHVSIWKGRTS